MIAFGVATLSPGAELPPPDSRHSRTPMSDDSLGECPKCGEDVLGMSITGPHEAYLLPCGHIAPPDAVRERGDGDGDV